MGFSTVIAHIALFTIFLSAFYLLYDTYDDYMREVGDETVSQTQRMKDQLASQITIASTSYSSSMLFIYLENTGESDMTTDNTDLYVDEDYVQSQEVEIQVLNTTFDPLIWNPGEMISINTSKTLTLGLHQVKVAANNAATASTQFTV